MKGSRLVAVLLPIVLLPTLGTCSRAKPPTALPTPPTPAPTAQADYSQPAGSAGPTETPQAVAPPVEIRILASDPNTGKPTLKVAYVPESEGSQAENFGDTLWSPDGEYLACWWNDRLWYLRAGSEKWESLPFESSQEERFSQGGLLGNGKLLVADVKSDRGSAVFLVDVTSGESKLILDEEYLKQRVGEIGDRFSYSFPGGVRWSEVVVIEARAQRGLLTAFFDAQGHHLQGLDVLSGSEGGGLQVAWSYDGSKALMGPCSPLGHEVLLLDAATAKVKHERFRDYPFFATWSPNGRFIALITLKDPEDTGCACAWGGTFALYEVATGKVTRYPALGTIGEMIWSPDGLSIAMNKKGGMEAKPGYLFSLKSRKARPLPNALAKKGETYSVSGWSPDGRYLATATETHADRLLDTKEWKIIVPKKGDGWLPANAKEGDWVWPLCHDESKEPVPPGGGWVRLGEPTAFEEVKYLAQWRDQFILRFGRFGRGQPSLIGETRDEPAWWPEPEASHYNGGHEWGLPG